MTDDQRVMYDNVGEVRNADAAMRWSIAQLFLVLHSALFTMLTTRFAEGIAVRIVMCLAGALLGLAWLFITDRTQELLTFWNERLRAFEQVGRQEIYVFGGSEYRALQNRKVTTYSVLLSVIVLITIVWSILFLYFVVSLRRTHF